MSERLERCVTCHGEGELGGENGPETCPDCCGLGRLPPAHTLRERRLRELEERYKAQPELARDVKYLAHEVRAAHHTLLQVMATAMDAPATDAWASRVRFLCNQAIGLYALDDEDQA